ncbi:hypothetical protein BDZ89DRAFT_516209 [Hymenopellis radicata]|nr:hypothetical protein BDZ89DRAFT_516209 [Hymenopellis radicata]
MLQLPSLPRFRNVARSPASPAAPRPRVRKGITGNGGSVHHLLWFRSCRVSGQNLYHWFIRRMLRLGKKSMKAPLYTETGIMPVRVGCYMLTLGFLGFLEYAIGLEDGHLAKAALTSARTLYMLGKAGWCNDLEVAAEKLPFAVPPDAKNVLEGPRF